MILVLLPFSAYLFLIALSNRYLLSERKVVQYVPLCIASAFVNINVNKKAVIYKNVFISILIAITILHLYVYRGGDH